MSIKARVQNLKPDPDDLDSQVDEAPDNIRQKSETPERPNSDPQGRRQNP